MLQLSHAHQNRPQRERNGEHLEGQGSSLVAVQIEDCGAIQQDASQANAEPDGWLGIGSKHAVQHVPIQRQAGERDPDRPHHNVIPTEMVGGAHEARRNEDAQRHRDQKKLADKKGKGRRRKGIENVVEGVECPGPFPRTESRAGGFARRDS